jgi:2-polyprenyl-3-methyl-5-hydroxy-6-metoxy-1,4-benzoquinol methylase
VTFSDQQLERPWQLEQFQRSLKKQLKLGALLELAGDVSGQRCLLITCGDNNGALNWHFRSHGGDWLWGDLEVENIVEMSELLDEAVDHVKEDHCPFSENAFDCVVSIDVLEHLQDDQLFLHQLRRVLRPNGRAIITVPNGDPSLLLNRIKWQVGMTPQVYGHTRAGYTVAELQDSVTQAGFTLSRSSGYSRLFTEMVELLINYGYVFVLSRKSGQTKAGQIAPTSSAELKTHGAAYRLYSLLYPVMRIISKMDVLLPTKDNYAVIVEARKSDQPA